MSIVAVVNFATLDGGTNGEIVSKTGAGSTRTIYPRLMTYYVVATNNGGHLYRGNGYCLWRYGYSWSLHRHSARRGGNRDGQHGQPLP